MEDQLDELMVETGAGSRYSRNNRGNLVEDQFGLDSDWKSVSFTNAATLQTWFEENVLTRLQKGESAVMGKPRLCPL